MIFSHPIPSLRDLCSVLLGAMVLSGIVTSRMAGQDVGELRPSVTITSPSNGAAVSGSLMIAVHAADHAGVSGVQIKLDGLAIGPELTAAPYAFSLNTSEWSKGVHVLTATARNASGKVGDSAAVAIQVAAVPLACDSAGVNTFFGCYFNHRDLTDLRLTRTDAQINFDWDSEAPDPSIQSDGFSARWQGNWIFAAGSSVFTLNIDGGARLSIDGELVMDEWREHPLSTYRVTRTLSAGTHLIRLDYFSAQGRAVAQLNWAQSGAPMVSITSPGSGSAVNGWVVISAAASSPQQIAGVQFKLDSANLGEEVTGAPYMIPVDSNSLADGNHVLTAVARDPAGRHGYASPVGVTIANHSLPPVSMRGPDSCESAGANSFVGCYFNSRDFTNLKVTRVDPKINFDWGLDSPDPLVQADEFSVRWQGSWTFANGAYLFSMNIDDGARLYIDGELVVDQWGEHGLQTYTATRTLSAGQHLIRLDYLDVQGRAVAQLSWRPQ